MSDRPADRREFARLELPRPLAARFGNAKAFVLDVSIAAAKLAIQQDLEPGLVDRLSFEHEGTPIVFEGEVVRSQLDREGTATARPVYHVAVKFLSALGDSDKVLREMITEYVTRALDEQKANARGIPPSAATFQTGVKRPVYIRCRYVNQKWVRTSTTESSQPLDGFTVAASESQEQIDMLCKTYEDADFEGRRMIRQLAEMSVGDEVVPTRRYTP